MSGVTVNNSGPQNVSISNAPTTFGATIPKTSTTAFSSFSNPPLTAPIFMGSNNPSATIPQAAPNPSLIPAPAIPPQSSNTSGIPQLPLPSSPQNFNTIYKKRVKNENLRIMTFLFNVDGVRICSKYEEDSRRGNLKTEFIRSKTREFCLRPDYFVIIFQMIFELRPDIVVFTTTDEDIEYTYFHAALLPTEMEKVPGAKYTLINRHKISSAEPSIKTDKSRLLPINIDEFMEQKTYYDYLISEGVKYILPSNSVTRTSIYVIKDDLNDYVSVKDDKNNLGNTVCYSSLSPGKIVKRKFREDYISSQFSSAICIYLHHKVFGKMAFISVHLPKIMDIFAEDSANISCYLGESERSELKFTMSRICLIKILLKFAAENNNSCFGKNINYNPNDMVVSSVDYTFLMGNFNFEIAGKKYKPGDNFNFHEAYLHDEMRQLLKSYSLKAYDPASVRKLGYSSTIKERPDDYVEKNESFFSNFKEGVMFVNPLSDNKNDDYLLGGPRFMPTMNLKKGRDLAINNVGSCAFNRAAQWNNQAKTLDKECYDFEEGKISGKVSKGKNDISPKNYIRFGPSEIDPKNPTGPRLLKLGWPDRIIYRQISPTSARPEINTAPGPNGVNYFTGYKVTSNGSYIYSVPPNGNKYNLYCTFYNSFDYGNTRYSSHAGVLGVFEIGEKVKSYIDISKGNFNGKINPEVKRNIKTYNSIRNAANIQAASQIYNINNKTVLPNITPENLATHFVFNKIILGQIGTLSPTFAASMVAYNLIMTDKFFAKNYDAGDDFKKDYIKALKGLKNSINMEFSDTDKVFMDIKNQASTTATSFDSKWLKYILVGVGVIAAGAIISVVVTKGGMVNYVITPPANAAGKNALPAGVFSKASSAISNFYNSVSNYVNDFLNAGSISSLQQNTPASSNMLKNLFNGATSLIS